MAIDKDFLLVVTADEVGAGPVDLGARLADLYLRNLAAAETRPARIIFLNSGIFLTTEGSLVVEHLRSLEAAGTEIVSCITCLTYHQRMDRIVVGRAGDMKSTVTDMTTFRKVVTL